VIQIGAHIFYNSANNAVSARVARTELRPDTLNASALQLFQRLGHPSWTGRDDTASSSQPLIPGGLLGSASPTRPVA
jgi:hypothetical protein